ncbi:thiol-disulfide isomerase [Leptotrichia sp. OH3620_COT-345]|uniref:thioredoxin family protein n=1 Tax=Leptotrichia sp. OH3620_COT-345 TaxID=2491048 RepID=UPI000F64ACB4|nr:thioredoxin family protein [Leptotrichia sp. OH3620_COT-345]RRD39412.1 thiol-disulfide isomerase [Leptotrichia sp. OH3620_COT-345]
MGTFQDYLNFSDKEEYSQKQLKIMDKITFSEETEKAVKSINKEIKILCFAQVYCPDCRAIVPFMKKFSEINNNIKVDYLLKENNEDLLKKLTDTVRIPTLVSEKDGKMTVFLLEFPNFIQKEMKKDPDSYEEIKYNFRTGKYNREIEKELSDYLTSL